MNKKELSSKRLEVLKASLIKKEEKFNDYFSSYTGEIKKANGQPLNDKRNGQATLNKWAKMDSRLSELQKEIEKTKDAIEREESKIDKKDRAMQIVPKEIQELVNDGVLIQWSKYPNMFFVAGVEKGRMIWDSKVNKLFNKYYTSIPTKEQQAKFRELYNKLNKILNE